MSKNIVIAVLVILLFGVLGYFIVLNNRPSSGGKAIATSTPIMIQSEDINSFEDCVDAGNPVMESFPRQCRSGDQVFTENIGNANEKADLIVVDAPRPNEEVSSPFTVEGQARGNWFFEASFPAYLYDAEGNEIGSAIVQAEGEWMTTEFVPFSFVMTYDNLEIEEGELVLKKDNPSFLPENDDELRIPLKLQ